MTEQSEIKLKKGYYARCIEAQEKLIEGIKIRLSNNDAATAKSDTGAFIIKGLPSCSPYELAKLQIELIEAEMQLAYNEDYLKHYIKRDTDYENFMLELTAECNANFDKIMQVAKDLPSRKQAYNSFILKTASDVVLKVKTIDLNDQGKKNDLYKLLRDQFDQNRVVWR